MTVRLGNNIFNCDWCGDPTHVSELEEFEGMQICPKCEPNYYDGDCDDEDFDDSWI